jgi:hypothetical protein
MGLQRVWVSTVDNSYQPTKKNLKNIKNNNLNYNLL